MLLCDGMDDELIFGTVTEWIIENSTLVCFSIECRQQMTISSTSGSRMSLCTLQRVKWHNCILQCQHHLCQWSLFSITGLICNSRCLKYFTMSDSYMIVNVKLINDSLSPRVVVVVVEVVVVVVVVVCSFI